MWNHAYQRTATHTARNQTKTHFLFRLLSLSHRSFRLHFFLVLIFCFYRMPMAWWLSCASAYRHSSIFLHRRKIETDNEHQLWDMQLCACERFLPDIPFQLFSFGCLFLSGLFVVTTIFWYQANIFGVVWSSAGDVVRFSCKLHKLFFLSAIIAISILLFLFDKREQRREWYSDWTN